MFGAWEGSRSAGRQEAVAMNAVVAAMAERSLGGRSKQVEVEDEPPHKATSALAPEK